MNTRLYVNGDWTAAADGAEFTTSDPATVKLLATCALITPWNFPLMIASWKLAPPSPAGTPSSSSPPSRRP